MVSSTSSPRSAIFQNIQCTTAITLAERRPDRHTYSRFAEEEDVVEYDTSVASADTSKTVGGEDSWNDPPSSLFSTVNSYTTPPLRRMSRPSRRYFSTTPTSTTPASISISPNYAAEHDTSGFSSPSVYSQSSEHGSQDSFTMTSSKSTADTSLNTTGAESFSFDKSKMDQSQSEASFSNPSLPHLVITSPIPTVTIQTPRLRPSFTPFDVTSDDGESDRRLMPQTKTPLNLNLDWTVPTTSPFAFSPRLWPRDRDDHHGSPHSQAQETKASLSMNSPNRANTFITISRDSSEGEEESMKEKEKRARGRRSGKTRRTEKRRLPSVPV